MKNSVAVALLLGSSALVSMPVFAQTPPPAGAQVADATPAEEEAPEIVVTAQNRVQNAQDVPIVMNVINAQQLAKAGFQDANDLGKIAPVAQITQDQGQVRITLRGIGTSAGPDTSVVTNIDGEYINNPAALGVSLFDLERVEVLRGPQGTLYGRNSTAGNVNYITRKPRDQFGANAAVSYGNYNSVRADAGVDIPIMTDIAVRVAGFYEDRDGYVKHPATAAGPQGFTPFVFPAKPASRSDDNHAYGGRVSLQGRQIGGSGFSVYLAGEYSKREFVPQLYAYADTHLPQYNPGANCQNAGWIKFAPLITDQTLCVPQTTNFLNDFNKGTYAQPRNGTGKQYWNTSAVRGRLDYKLSSAATISYIGGYRFFEIEPKSTSSLPVVYGNLTAYNKNRTQSHELRVAGDIGGIVYQAGGFYFKETIHSLNGFYLGDITPGTTNFGLFINTFLRNQDSDSKSVFGQVEVPILDTLTAVGGARYTDAKRTAFWRDKSPAASFIGPTIRTLTDANSIPRNLLSHDKKATWLVGLNYKPDSSTLVYGKVSTGFKGGGFDTVGTFGPETNTAYEAGLKKNFGERHQHLFNLTAFDYDYKGLQVGVLLNSAEGGRVFNAGRATIRGLEAEASFELDRQTHFNGTVNYLDAKYKQFLTLYNVYCVPGPTATLERNEGGRGNCATNAVPPSNLTGVGDLDPVTPGIQQPDLAGNPTSFSPQFVITAGLDHRFDLGSIGSLTAQVDVTFKTRYYTGPYKQTDSSQGPISTTNASLEYRMRNGFSLTAYVRNIENIRALSYGTFTTAATDDIWNWQFGTPRTYGVRAAFDF